MSWNFGTSCFCETCLSLGYHSILHQVRFLNKCPVHNTYLLNKCPSCSRSYSYNLSNPNMKKPYVCKCGYQYTVTDKIVQMYTNFQQKIEINLDIKAKLNQLTKDVFMSHIVFYEDTDTQVLNKNVERVYQLKQDGRIEEGIVTKISSHNKPFSRSNQELCKNLNPFNESNEIYKVQKAIYKCIARKVRKKHLKKHKKCIRNLTLKGSFSNVCHHAHKYVCWRKFIEGANGYHNVQTTKDIYYMVNK